MIRLESLRRTIADLSRVHVPARLYWFVVVVVVVVGFGIFANPWVVGPSGMTDRVGEGILIVEGLVGIGWCGTVALTRWRSVQTSIPLPASATDSRRASFWKRVTEAGLFLYIVALWLTMFWPRVSDPKLSSDDASYVEIAGSWESTRENLFTPFGEHLCVITRVTTWLVCSTVEERNWPRALAYSGMALFAASFVLLHLFARREWDSPTIGLATVSLFVLTPVHSEVVTWYSASQWCWVLMLLFASLLILQAGGPVPKNWKLATSAVLAAVGPFNYAVGLLIGPLSAAYLTLCRRPRSVELSLSKCIVPIAGTIAFLAGFIPIKASQIMADASYGGRPAAEAIAPLWGVLFGVRSTVDMLLLCNLGYHRVSMLPRSVYLVLFLSVVFVVTELIRKSERPGAAILGFLFVVLPYALMLPFRAWVEYDNFKEWNRYQLFPQVGVVLLVSAALAAYAPRWLFAADLTGRHALFILALASVQFLVHALN